MENNYTLGHHVVAYLDILGQREAFRRLQIPTTAEEHAKVAEVLRQTAGFVSELRERFRKQFERFEDGISKGPLQSEYSVKPKFVGFSDSFVVSVALRNDRGDLLPIVTLFSALSAAAVVMLNSLANKHALRGGIDVGLATEIGPQEIYGTALERAYQLECQRASYPRVLIGDELWRYLSVAVARFENDQTPSAKAAVLILRRAQQLISTDTDGERILDYLGPVIAELMNHGEEKIMIQPSYDFVVAEHNRLRNDEKLGQRYAQLRRYFESRLARYGIPSQPWH